MAYTIGDRFGDFEIIKPLDPALTGSGNKMSQWLLGCVKCGEDKSVLSSNLRRFKGSCKICAMLPEGHKFGRWTLVSQTTYTTPSTGQVKRAWVCRCECGTLRTIAEGSLRFGSTESCGCLSSELKTTHGASGTRELNIYLKMLLRCSEKAGDFERPYYYDKGIRVCDRWLEGFESFFEDMGVCPENYSIERLDSNKGYSKENCIWADDFTQASNRGKFSNNTSGKTGVQWEKSSEKWRVHLHYRGVLYSGGRFADFDEACEKRRQLELDIIGKLKGH